MRNLCKVTAVAALAIACTAIPSKANACGSCGASRVITQPAVVSSCAAPVVSSCAAPVVLSQPACVTNCAPTHGLIGEWNWREVANQTMADKNVLPRYRARFQRVADVFPLTRSIAGPQLSDSPIF